MCSFTWSASCHPASSILYLISLSLSFVWFSPEDTFSYLQCISPQRMKSAVLLFCPDPTNSLLIHHPFSFLVHFYLGTYIVFLLRILQFRTCPHLSPYSMLFIIWGNIHYSVGRTTSVWTVSQFVDPVIAGRLLLPSASHVPSLGMECSLGVYQHLLIRLPTGQLGIYYGVQCYSPVSLWPKDDSLFLSHLLTLCWMDEHFLFCILNLFIHSYKYGGIDSRALFE